jgi:multicomponent Na+:H+ antiporter subunit B
VSRRARLAMVALAGTALAIVLVVAVTDLPRPDAPPPRSAKLSTSVALHERHVTNIVAGITFDLRGLDTLGEELILFAAAVGVSVLLRAQREENTTEDAAGAAEQRRAQVPASARALGAALAGPMIVFGGYIVAHGQLTPGGGFQGGVILAAALLLVYVAGQVLALPTDRPVDLVELTEALAAAAYGLVAVGGLIFASAAVMNFVALGITGHLLSGGTILILEVAVGIEVASALTLILAELLDQALLRST